MTLSTDTRLGQYEVLAPIGAGGMGEVYRARDTKLGREVAIKVLPEELSQEPERLARFEREARLLASLNHPAIATLHGFEDGFLVMELVEGETLEERIARGPIPIDEARALFIQIADGLEAAHEKGIIHRDLKPANIKITPDGQIKILDFGLAKAFAPEEGDDVGTSQSPTLTKGTALGAIMGTASYMSPEQARGKSVDKRTDVWAFGCCLYEALTGKKAFAGETVADVIGAVVHKEPRWDGLISDTPRRLRTVLKRCLNKDARRRVHDIADVRLDLEEPEEDQTMRDPTSRWRWVAVGVVALVSGLVGMQLTRSRARMEATHLLIDIAPAEQIGDEGVASTPGRQLSRQLSRTAFAISPDGRDIAFTGWEADRLRLFHRRLDEPEARAVPGSEGAMSPFFSPDGAWVGFWSAGKLRKVPIAGGPVVPLCDSEAIFGVSWGSSGTIIFAEKDGGLLEIPEDGGTPERFTSVGEERSGLSHRLPWVLPDGNTILFTIVESGDWETARIAIHDRRTGESHVLVEGGAHPVYAPSGHLVYAKLGELWAVPFDARRLELTGAARPVVPGVVQTGRVGYTNNTFAAQYAVSATGTLVYLPGDVEEFVPSSLVWVERDGRSESIPVEPGIVWTPRVAPDGSRVALYRDGRVLIHDFERAVGQYLLDADGGVAGWSPEGSRVVFSREFEGARNLVSQFADGSVPAERLTTSARSQFPNTWSSDGSTVFFSESRGLGTSDIMALSLNDSSLPSGPPKPLLSESFSEWHPAISPDGRWLAYASNESGRYEVYLRSYPDLGQKLQLSRNGGEAPAWSASGAELYFMRRSPTEDEPNVMLSVSLEWEPRVRPGTPAELFRGRFVMSDNYRSYDVSRDGRFLMLVRPERETNNERPRIVLNWFSELERLVPTEK